MADDKKQFKWYCLRVVSNKERKIKERIELEIDRAGWKELIPQIILPIERLYKFKNGKKVVQERTLMPGYLIVEALNDVLKRDEILQVITDVKDVIHFLGDKNPTAMKEEEIKHILGKLDKSEESGELPAEDFIPNEPIKITGGPFQGFHGTVKEVNEERKKIIVITKVFGRDTEVELEYMQVEKQS